MRPASQLLLCLCGALLLGCGGKEAAPPAATTPPAGATGDLTPFQVENGIGPVTEGVTLGALDKEMAEAGEKTFTTKCSACHKMSDRYVGPPLANVTIRRKPAFIMNQILNPEGMYTRHPVIKQLLGEYMMQMPNQGLTRDEARKVLEYLRTESHVPTAS